VQAALAEAQRARLVSPPMPQRDPEKAELDRRQFLNRGIVGGTALGLGIFGAASLAFMYPKLGKGFGGKVSTGVTPKDATDVLKNSQKPYYNGEGRFYIVPFITTPATDEDAKKIYPATY